MFLLMPKRLEETVMFTNDDEGFQDLFDMPKQSLKMSEIRKQSRRDDPMNVDALSKGKTKGKGKEGPAGSGKGNKDQNHVNDVGKSKLNSVESSNWQEHADGWLEEGTSQSHREHAEHVDGWRDEEHSDGWWKSSDSDGWWTPSDEQTGSSSGWWASAGTKTPWEPEPVCGFEINNIEPKHMPKYIKQDEWGQEWTVSVAENLHLEKGGQFRVASGAANPNLGNIKMESMGESGIVRSIRGHIIEVAKPLQGATEVSKIWDSSLRRRRNPFRNEILGLLWKSEQCWPNTMSGSTTEGASGCTVTATCAMRTCELAMSNWNLRRTDVDDGDHDERDEAEQPEELKRVLAARQPSELDRQKHCQMNHAVFAPWCKVRVKAKGTGAQHEGVGKIRTGWTQNLLRLLLHVRGRSFHSDACSEVQQVRQNSRHSVGAGRLDAVRGKVPCRRHPADWSSKVHQQE